MIRSVCRDASVELKFECLTCSIQAIRPEGCAPTITGVSFVILGAGLPEG